MPTYPQVILDPDGETVIPPNQPQQNLVMGRPWFDPAWGQPLWYYDGYGWLDALGRPCPPVGSCAFVNSRLSGLAMMII